MALDDDQTANQPLAGVVLCCTSILADVRTKLADSASQMGAALRLDLTSDVTHLLVGNIDTPKYKYVAKERPDIKVLHPDWVDAVREAWMAGEEAVDVESLERAHNLPTFFGLKFCVTKFETLETQNYFSQQATKHGGSFSGDLTRDVTHLVAAQPQGAKYTHAKQWGISVVSRKWFEDSLQRGMALDESLYPPELPIEEQGLGAFRVERKPAKSNLGKRDREGEERASMVDGDGKRKMRRIASRRLDAHSQDLWQDMSGQELYTNKRSNDAWKDDIPNADEASSEGDNAKQRKSSNAATTRAAPSDESQALFSSSQILVHGFEPKRADRIREFLIPNGANVVQTAEELESDSFELFFEKRYLLTPHATPDEDLNLPSVPLKTVRVTEWWVERCIHYKTLLDPEDDVLSRPLGNVAISGLNNVFISTTGFTGVDLRQTAEAVKLMNAEYQEVLLPSTQILVCASDKVKKEKAFYATKHNIPVVRAEWLWKSLKSGKKTPIEHHQIRIAALGHEDVSQPSSERSPAPSLGQTGRTGDIPQRPDVGPKRLSSSRKTQARPALELKSSKPNRPKHGPFVHEDDEHDDAVMPVTLLDELTAAANESRVTHEASHPLREISPNASPRKESVVSIENVMETEKQTRVQAIKSQDEQHSQSLSSKGGERMDEGPGLIMRSSGHLAEQITSLMELRRASRPEATDARSPQKRKGRPLGRNPSGIGNRSVSATARSDSLSRTFPADLRESNSPADGFVSAPRVEEEAPSTQVGYETPEMEAHRKQMSKKMGTNLQDDSTGKRVASLGTVKDSEGITRKSGRNQTRAKQR